MVALQRQKTFSLSNYLFNQRFPAIHCAKNCCADTCRLLQGIFVFRWPYPGTISLLYIIALPFPWAHRFTSTQLIICCLHTLLFFTTTDLSSATVNAHVQGELINTSHQDCIDLIRDFLGSDKLLANLNEWPGMNTICLIKNVSILTILKLDPCLLDLHISFQRVPVRIMSFIKLIVPPSIWMKVISQVFIRLGTCNNAILYIVEGLDFYEEHFQHDLTMASQQSSCLNFGENSINQQRLHKNVP